MSNKEYFYASADLIKTSIDMLGDKIDETTKLLIDTISDKHKILICGNGGSAADSQHFAAEIVGTFYNKSRKGLPAIALTTDTSIITAVANDLGYDNIFARQVEGLALDGDVLIVISTSGNSKNCIKAIEKAKEIGGIKTIGFLGGNGGALSSMCDHSLIIPSGDTPLIQQVHLCIYHWMCKEIDVFFS